MKYLLKLKIVFKIKFKTINLCYIYTHSFKYKQLLSKNKIWIMVTRAAFFNNIDSPLVKTSCGRTVRGLHNDMLRRLD